MFGGGESIRAPLRVSVGSVMVSCYPRARRGPNEEGATAFVQVLDDLPRNRLQVIDLWYQQEMVFASEFA